MRHAPLAAPLALALLAACGGTDTATLAEQSPGVVYVVCGDDEPFPASALEGPENAETEDDPAAEALRAWTAKNDVEPNVPRTGWRRLVRNDRSASFVHGPHYAHLVSFARKDGTWRWAGYGSSCRPRVAPPRGTESADWVPAAKVRPEATSFVANVTGRGCASGRSSEGRIEPPRVTYTATAVVVTFFVRPPEGRHHTCQGSPPAPYEVTLSEPLGSRTLLDGGQYPPAPPGPTQRF